MLNKHCFSTTLPLAIIEKAITHFSLFYLKDAKYFADGFIRVW